MRICDIYKKYLSINSDPPFPKNIFMSCKQFSQIFQMTFNDEKKIGNISEKVSYKMIGSAKL